MVWTTAKTIIASATAAVVAIGATTYGIVKYVTTTEIREIVRTEMAPANDLLNGNDLVLAAIKTELEKQTAILTAEFAREEQIKSERSKRFRVDPQTPGKW